MFQLLKLEITVKLVFKDHTSENK